MKFIHLSDLHLGKKLNEYSLVEDQRYILNQIENIIKEEKPDAVLIAGDVYDKSIPSIEANELFDDFVSSLTLITKHIFIISGNHDSPERLSVLSRLVDKLGLHISEAYNGVIKPLELKDEYGNVDVYMLPFVKPQIVKKYFPDDEINSYTDAIRVAIDHMNVDESKRNVLVVHQFVTGARRSESEEVTVGGLDNVDASVFSVFDYVALGHIHSPQKISSERIYYSGTPLKYSFSEANDTKSVAVVELKNKGEITLRTIMLKPLHELRVLEGTYDEIMSKKTYEGTTYQSDYVKVILKDEDDILNALGNLRTVYHNLMELRYDNKRTRTMASIDGNSDSKSKTPLELFSELFEAQNGCKMSDKQTSFIKSLIEDIWEV